MRPSQRGFTLVELMIVMVVLALVTIVALPQLTSARAKAELQSSSREVAAALRSTRSLAMAAGHSQSLVLDTGAGVLRAPSARPVVLPRDIRPVLFTAAQEQSDAASGRIRFFPDGSSTGGGIRLIQGNTQSEVLVDWLTGAISVATR